MNKQLECPNCHKMNRPDATFCAFCGSALNKSTTRNNYSQQKKGWFSRHKWLSLLLLVILLALFGGGSVLGWQSYQNKNSGNKIISTFKTNPKKIYYNKLSATDRKKVNFKFTAIQIPGSDMGGGNYKVKENIKNATNKSVRFHLKSFYLSNNGVNDHIMSKLKGNITIQPGKSYTIKKVFNNVGGQSLVIGYFSYLNDNFKLAYITHSLFKLKGCTSNNLTNKSLIKQNKKEKQQTATNDSSSSNSSSSSSSSETSSKKIDPITFDEACTLISKGGFTDFNADTAKEDTEGMGSHQTANGGFEMDTSVGAKGKDIFTLTPNSDGTVRITDVYGTLDGGSFSVLDDQASYGPSSATVKR